MMMTTLMMMMLVIVRKPFSLTLNTAGIHAKSPNCLLHSDVVYYFIVSL